MEVRPGYKMTEVGVIPEDWEVRALGEMGQALIGLTYRPEDVASQGTLVLRSSNIQGNSIDFKDNVFVRCRVPQRLMTCDGDVLICVRNGSRALIGKSILLGERAKGMTFGAFMTIFRSSHGPLVSLLFQSPIVKRQIGEHLGATINQITNKSLTSFLVPVPTTHDERKTITTALGDVDALLGALERLIAKKRNLKQATMQQLLTGQTRLPGFTGDWRVQPLVDIAPLQRGFDLPTSNLLPGPFPVVYSNGVMNYHAKAQSQGPGVVTGRSGTIGNVTFVDEPFWPHNTALWVTSFKQNNPRFVFYLYTKIDFERFSTGSGVPTLNRNDVHAFEVAIPEINEQNAIAAVLTDMDADLAALEQRLAKTRALKQGMMQGLLTGRIRLVHP